MDHAQASSEYYALELRGRAAHRRERRTHDGCFISHSGGLMAQEIPHIREALKRPTRPAPRIVTEGFNGAQIFMFGVAVGVFVTALIYHFAQ